MKKALSIATPLGTYLTLASSAFAVDIQACAAGDFSILCNLSTASIGNLIGTFVSLLFIIAVVAALIYLVMGGLKWLTSGGDKQAVATAREHIVAAIIGLVIVFLSYFILNIILGVFLGISLSQVTLPQLPGS